MPIYDVVEYEQRYGYKSKRYPIPTDCGSSEYERIVHPESTWRFLQNLYHESRVGKHSYHHRLHSRHRYLCYSGLPDVLEVRDYEPIRSPRGRALYAAEPIPPGRVVWFNGISGIARPNVAKEGGQGNLARFCSKEKLVQFLEQIPDHDLQCDFLLWSYPTRDWRWNNETAVTDPEDFMYGYLSDNLKDYNSSTYTTITTITATNDTNTTTTTTHANDNVDADDDYDDYNYDYDYDYNDYNDDYANNDLLQNRKRRNKAKKDKQNVNIENEKGTATTTTTTTTKNGVTTITVTHRYEKIHYATGCVECALDEASYTNHGESPQLVNIDTASKTIRRISAGEEILQDYNEFIASGNISLDWWDEIRSVAWGRHRHVASTKSINDNSENANNKKKNDDDVKKDNKESTLNIMDEYVTIGMPQQLQDQHEQRKQQQQQQKNQQKNQHHNDQESSASISDMKLFIQDNPTFIGTIVVSFFLSFLLVKVFTKLDGHQPQPQQLKQKPSQSQSNEIKRQQ